MKSERARHEFRVVVNDIELPDEVLQRINEAVQKAAVSELARVDLGGDFHVRFPRFPRPPGSTWGIWIDPISNDELDRAGLKTPSEFE